MRRIVWIPLGAAVIIATASCGRPDPAEWTMTLQRVEAPPQANTSEPQLSASSRGVILSWAERVGSTTQLRFSERSASGWSAPITAAAGDDWFLSYADVPSVARLGNGTLVAQWLQLLDPITEAYNLRLSYSKDNGKTWAPSFLPHHDGTKSQHGFASFIELAGNTLGVIWLDGRNSEFKEDDPASGTMMLRYAAYDANWKQVAETEIDRRVCECCPTSAVMTTDGVLTAYRDRTDEEIRDIVVSRLEGGKWTAPTVVGLDNWKVDFCPVNGPMLSARGRDVVASWFTVKNDVGQSYAAFSADAGRTWSMPVRVDDAGSLGRTDVELLDDGTAVASWIEYAEGQSNLRVRLIERSGGRSAPITVAGVTGGRASGYPRMARQGNDLIVAWTDTVWTTGTSGEQSGLPQVNVAVGQLPD